MAVSSEFGTLAETTVPNAYDMPPDEEKKQPLDDAPEEDPFGNEECAEVKYRTLGWCSIILMIGVSFIAWYTAYLIYQFKMRYLHIHSMADAGEVILGRFGRELLGGGQLLFLVFVMASHILTFTVAMNTITDHGTCTIVFGIVALVISCIGSLPRTMGNVYWISFALGHASFFGFVSEMEQPREFPKSIAVLQIIDTSLYIVSAVVIYRYVGVDVASPALGSAGPVMKKVAYGLALPTVSPPHYRTNLHSHKQSFKPLTSSPLFLQILIAGIVNGHVAAKYVYVRLFRGTNHMHETTLLSKGSWVAIALILWVVSWVIAESIPIFNDLLSFITALLGCWFAFGFPAIFYFVLNKGQWFSSPWKTLLSVINLCILGIAFATCGLGLYVSGDAISRDSNNSVWTCASNGV
ncbi:hypothetical protein ASPACDRAFT_1888536 [Aspergillus aculeatus ATCC 16872]|uniref:Amino acid transporter transmembrane domain-containing protein n=1 Tax=Aspergillus aculeatus (strain ATCC 16872 / CBS 172.66 / WB 5094) TaxID=690307 RepID=A0A1L9WUS9_ASPA1|nr:uncharacterized protein ASPACDRAFT_1888536 [Aspergillus aculeatus ATCC 16872]OJJ99888.1 hypothetical protein ASPACDRAFT_1888536 [Aspergillus aculeatus ATCC 16872]